MNCTSSSQGPQRLSREELKSLLETHGIIDALHRGRYRVEIERNEPAREAGGRECFISYYDGDQYVCTKHRVTVGILDDIQEVHQDVEAAFINGVRYERERG